MSHTPEEKFLAELNSARMAGFGFLRQVAEAPPELLKAFGYSNKTNAEALLLAFKSLDKEIQHMIEDFERKNPR